MPLIGGGETKFQPVFVGDVATAVAKAALGEARPGTTYELGGPEVMSLRRVMELVLKMTNRKPPPAAAAVRPGDAAGASPSSFCPRRP